MKRALIVGADYMGHDYQTLAKKIYDRLQYNEKVLLTTEASPARVLDELRALVHRSTNYDVITLYLSGHCESMYRNYISIGTGILLISEIMDVIKRAPKRALIQIILDCHNSGQMFSLPYRIHKYGYIETGFECMNNIILLYSNDEIGSLTNLLLSIPHAEIPAITLTPAVCVTSSRPENLLVYI